MTRTDLLSRSVALALISAAGASMAQTAPSGSAAVAGEEIIVTGSMIKRSSAETTEAVSVISTDSLKEMGVTTVEQALSLLSGNQSGITSASAVAAFTGGGTYASLRALGESKTLILLDGQRLANNVQAGNAVDLSTLPFAAIERIEVLREGASSLYGSDAIAGVINFITKKDFETGELNLSYNKPQQSGGSSNAVDLSWGHGNVKADGYNILVAGNFTGQRELVATQRSFSSTGFDPARNLENQNGPYGTAPGSYLDANGSLWQVGYPACAGNPFLTTYYKNCAYLYSAAVDLIPKQETYSGLISATKALSNNNQINAQYFYAKSDQTTWGGPQTYFFELTPQNNPNYYPTAANSTCSGGAANCSTSTPALGGPIQAGWTDPANNRYFYNKNTEQRFLLTFSGANGGWDYSTAFNYSVNKNNFGTSGGEADYSVLAPGNLLNNLVNPFGPQTAAGQAFINSAYRTGDLATGSLSLYGLNGHASHELGDAFGSGHAASLAVGFDTRWEKIDFNPTPLATTLYTSTYYPPQQVHGSRNSQALFFEINVPVTSQFEVTLSDREDRFSDFGNTNNAKLALRYQPLSSLTFRGAASTGFRAPSLTDLYSPQVLGAVAGTIDGPPCPAGGAPPFTASNCQAQGLGLSGGNPSLGAETSQNLDLGVIYAPIAGLDFTLDYYRINIKNEIQTIPAQTIYQNPTQFASLYKLNNQNNLTQAPAANIDCPTPAAATCGYIIRTLQNTGGITTDGLDFSANYVQRTGYGNFRLGFEGTLITEYRLQPYAGARELNLVGQFNQGFQPAIRWKHLATLDWTNQNWGAGLSESFVDGYVDQYNSPDNSTQLKVGNYSVWNGYVSWKPIDSLGLTVGIRNLLNTDPPFSNQTQNWQSGYNPLFSDPLGRVYYGKLTYKF